MFDVQVCSRNEEIRVKIKFLYIQKRLILKCNVVAVKPIGNELFGLGAYLRPVQGCKVFPVFRKGPSELVVVKLIDDVVQNVALQREQILAVGTLLNQYFVKDLKNSFGRGEFG